MQWRGIDQRKVVDANPGRVNHGLSTSRRQLRGHKIETQAIGTGDEMNEGFEMGCRDGPADRREIILVMVDGDTSVQWMMSWISDLAVDKQDFLMDLGIGL